MLKACSVELLADVRDKVRHHAGEVQALGTPVVSVRDGYTVVDIPVALGRPLLLLAAEHVAKMNPERGPAAERRTPTSRKV